MKKFYILLEDDWELRGNGLGNVAELQYVPSLFLMNLCEELNIKMTFMVDVAQQLKFIEYQEFSEIKLQKELWDNTVKLMKQKGFDIQLHLHPQWTNAYYENGFFYVSDNWNIGTYPDAVRQQLVGNAVKYLEELLSPIDANYKIHSFKPGSWGIQPSEGILKDLYDNGINLVIGMNKGLYISNQKIDYRHQEEDTYPYYPNLKDITKVSDSKQDIIALPLAPFYPSFIDLFNLFSFLLKNLVLKKVFCKLNNKVDVPQEIRDLNLLSRFKFNDLFKLYENHLKIGNQPYIYLKSSFDSVIKRLSKLEDDNIVILMEAHTKDFVKNYDNIEKFLRYVVEKYKDKVEFITLSEFNEKIKDNQFRVRYKQKNEFKQKYKIRKQFEFYLTKLIKKSFLFNKIYKGLIKSQYYTQEQLNELQNRQLRKLVKHCYKNVPYYKELFDNLNLKPKDIQTKEDLKKLPFLDKSKVKENFVKFISKNAIKSLCYLGTTGGTSGVPTKILRDYYSINFENAIVSRFFNNIVGKSPKKVTIRSNVVVPIEQKEPPFWEHNLADNELIMSPIHLIQENAQIYIDKIIEFNPQILYLQPSTACLLAKFFYDKPHSLNIKAIFTSSENLSNKQRLYIEKVFKSKIYDWYGQAERVAAIGQCKNGTYHIIEDYSIVELLKKNDNYEICGTSLYNFAMPLLRYKTGDFVNIQENKCSCNSSFREIKNIKGRSIYYILTPENNKILNVELIHTNISHVIEVQYIQEAIDKLTINIVTEPEFNINDEMELVKSAIMHTSPDMLVKINKVDSIQRGSNGKFVTVIRKFEMEEKDLLENVNE